MAAENVFDRLMDRLRRGDEEAAAAVFHRFARRLIALARSQLDSWIRTRVEPEDVIQSVFRSFFTRFASGQLQIDDWDNLWTVLTLITVRKCVNRIEFWQATKRDPRREAPLAAESDWPAEALARDPTPLEAAILSEVVEQLMKTASARDRAHSHLALARLRHRRHQRAGGPHRTHRAADAGTAAPATDPIANGRGRRVERCLCTTAF